MDSTATETILIFASLKDVKDRSQVMDFLVGGTSTII